MLMKVMDYVKCWIILLTVAMWTFCIGFTMTAAVHMSADQNADKDIRQTLSEAYIDFIGYDYVENEAE